MKQPEKSVTPCEEFFLLVTEVHICSVAMRVFNMSTAADRPCTELFPEGYEKLNPQQQWKVLQLAVTKIVDQFVDIIHLPQKRTTIMYEHMQRKYSVLDCC